MAIKPGDKANFQTLLRAAENGHLSLIESADAVTGEYRAVLCAVVRDGDEGIITPFGHLCTGNPYEQYKDPVKLMEDETA